MLEPLGVHLGKLSGSSARKPRSGVAVRRERFSIRGSKPNDWERMEALYDYRGMSVRLTEERLAHILEHPEMKRMQSALEQTLAELESVIRSLSDPDARLYYRTYTDTPVGEKLLCVVVKVLDQDAFVLTAYLTDRIKRGEVLWSAAR